MKRLNTSQIITNLLPGLATWLLPLFVLILLLFTLAAIFPAHIAGSASILLAVSGACLFVYRSRSSGQPMAEWAFNKEMLLSIFAIGAANWLTFVLNHSLRMGPVIASAVIGLAGGVLFPKYGAAIYCGSFVGMSSRAVLPHAPAHLSASLIAGIIFQISENTFDGIGGKLGTIAFIGSVITGAVFGLPFSSSLLPPSDIAWSIIILSVLAALLTWVLGNQQKIGAVIGSALVGLAGGLILPRLFPAYGELMAVAVFCASFTGMASEQRFSAVLVTIAGLLTGIIFFLSFPVFGGAGGKLGMIAFSASLATLGYYPIACRLQLAIKARNK